MMSSETIVERAARAVRDTIASFDNSDKDIARAVLRAIREPSEDALIAGAAAIEDTDVWDATDTKPYWGAEWTPCAKASWKAMIDTALSTPDAHHD